MATILAADGISPPELDLVRTFAADVGHRGGSIGARRCALCALTSTVAKGRRGGWNLILFARHDALSGGRMYDRMGEGRC